MSLKEFKPETMCADAAVVIFGSRRQGKSHLLHWLFYINRKKYDEVHLFSKTARFQKESWFFVPQVHFHDIVDDGVLNALITSQEDLLKLKGRKKLPIIALIFDDIITDPRLRSSGKINDIFVLGRHLGISIWVSSQVASAKYSLNQCARNNVDYVFCTYLNNQEELKKVGEFYLANEGVKKAFFLLTSITEKPHTFLVRDFVNGGIGGLEEICSEIKAPEKLPPKFSIDVEGKKRKQITKKHKRSAYRAMDKEELQLFISQLNLKVIGKNVYKSEVHKKGVKNKGNYMTDVA